MESAGSAYTFTQFESDDARGAFPCWDEPEFKYPFQMSLTVPTADKAITNTPVESTESMGASKQTDLQEDASVADVLAGHCYRTL